MKTRQDYIDGKVSHAEYYEQFVTEETKKNLLRHISQQELLASTNEHLNDISLGRWDAIPATTGTTAAMKDCGDYLTQAGNVCIYKAAARMIIDEAKSA